MKSIAFIDEARIKIKSGNGGDGKLAFHREKYVEFGGPSGGNGGNGGSIYFKATDNENTLLKFRGQKIYKAQDGTKGDIKNMTGANGEDLIIEVPIGTEVIINSKKIIDLTYKNQLHLAQEGGKGGRGNKSFKSSKNTAPTIYEKGEKVPFLEVDLNLKLLADVGLLGLPNAGKSTLLSVVSKARPKIANYPFTTIQPQLGVVTYFTKTFVIADLPGLIEGASENKGVGIKFLKHLSRTKFLLHLLDGSDNNFKVNYQTIRKELSNYSKLLENMEEIIVITKKDLVDLKREKEINDFFKKQKIFFISSIKKEGLDALLMAISNLLAKLEKEQLLNLDNLDNKEEKAYYTKYKNVKDADEFKIKYIDNHWEISGKYSYYWANRIPLTTHENYFRIIKKFDSKGILVALKKAGLKKGDIITVKDSDFSIEYDEEF